jgi:hypothetical protein
MILQGATKVDDSQKPPNFLKNLLQRTSKQGRRERGREREGAGEQKRLQGLKSLVAKIPTFLRSFNTRLVSHRPRALTTYLLQRKEGRKEGKKKELSSSPSFAGYL